MQLQKDTTNIEPPTMTPEEVEEEEQRLSNWIVDQMNVGNPNPNYKPWITDPSQLPTRIFDSEMTNIWVDGRGLLTCDSCVVHTGYKELSVWKDLMNLVHFPIVPTELKTGPDVHQCFCGYLSMRPVDLEKHLETKTPGPTEEERRAHTEAVAAVLDQFKQVLRHDECYTQLENYVTRQEYARRPNQVDFDRFNVDPNYDDGRIEIKHT